MLKIVMATLLATATLAQTPAPVPVSGTTRVSKVQTAFRGTSRAELIAVRIRATALRARVLAHMKRKRAQRRALAAVR